MKRSELIEKLAEQKLSITNHLTYLQVSCKVLDEIIKKLEKVEDDD